MSPGQIGPCLELPAKEGKLYSEDTEDTCSTLKYKVPESRTISGEEKGIKNIFTLFLFKN